MEIYGSEVVESRRLLNEQVRTRCRQAVESAKPGNIIRNPFPLLTHANRIWEDEFRRIRQSQHRKNKTGVES